jgi:peptide/nickel transport system substrate-binding protein
VSALRRADPSLITVMLHEDGCAIIPVFREWIDAHNEKAGGHTPHSGFDMDNGYIVEKAWIKA